MTNHRDMNIKCEMAYCQKFNLAYSFDQWIFNINTRWFTGGHEVGGQENKSVFD